MENDPPVEGEGISFQAQEAHFTRCFIVRAELRQARGSSQPAGERSMQAQLDEMSGLAEAIDLDIVGREGIQLSRIVPATFLGKGKIEEIAAQLSASEAELVVFDGQLSPGQQRNLERAWKVKVLDRTGLILEIFGRRAQTREGALQVELAHLEYQKTRLVRSWTHLERQRGGFGFLGGPGETQIEADRRMIRDRIAAIKKQIAQIKRTRGLHREARRKVPYPVVALVGYTNAGKSTLFNRLTDARVFAEDLLFATLDPTMRQLALPHGRKVILSDTVGFISDLPTMLVAAFRATLEEVLSADVIVHVRDISHPDSDRQASDVHGVLRELGIEAARIEAMIEFWNKADLASPEALETLHQQSARRPGTVIGSAVTGDGLDALTATIEEYLAATAATWQIVLDATQGRDIAWLYQNAEVLERTTMPDGETRILARIQPEALTRAHCRFAKNITPAAPPQADLDAAQ